jgi:glycosyltransferase involved in cell wall biosynthesis
MPEHLRSGEYGDYVLVVGRLEPVKRTDLAIRALAHAPSNVRLIIVGNGIAARGCRGPQPRRQESPIASSLREALPDQRSSRSTRTPSPSCTHRSTKTMGYVTLEAFLSEKPVITATDSGGTLEFVRDGENGFVCTPDPAAIGAAITRLAADRQLAARLGQAGLARARTVTWDGVVEQLLG